MPATAGATSEIRHAVPLAVAAALVGLVSLLTTVFVAHVLTKRGYGTLVILLAIFLVVSLPGSAILVGVVRRVSSWDAGGLGGRVRPWVARVHRSGEAAIVALAVFSWLIRVPIAHGLNLPGPSGVAEVLIAGGFWINISVDRGVLQVRRAYTAVSVNLVLESVARCALTLAMAAELGVEGAALGLMIAEAVAAAHARLMATRSLVHVAPVGAGALPDPQSMPEMGVEAVGGAVAMSVHGGRDLAADVFAALGSLAVLALMQNTDVLFLGSKAPGHSGAYAAISVPAKALVFGALVLVNYLLPEATIRHQRGSHALRQLGYTLLVLAAPCGVLLVLSAAVPRRMLSIVFGPKYTDASSAFSTLVLAMVLLSVTVVLTVYLLGVGWRWVLLVLTVGEGALAAAMDGAGGGFLSTARGDLAVQAGLAAAMVVCFVVVHRRSGRRRGEDGVRAAPPPDAGFPPAGR
ncbi:MAG TPA: hypothetical protein VLZ77_01320 [Acidimicrobiales bacterium]|nr:hypothetical protein [Acidimicrobiales bacterium]